MKNDINGTHSTPPVEQKEDMSKEVLLSSNLQFQEALEDQLSEIKENAEKWMKSAAIIGGAMFIGYSIYKLFMEEEEEELLVEKENEQIAVKASAASFKDSPIVRMIMESIAMFLISIARQKLVEYLDRYDEQNGNIEIQHEEESLGTN